MFHDFWKEGEFLSVSWASQECESQWRPRIAAIVDAMHDVELVSVAFQLRRCAIKWIAAESLPELVAQASALSLTIAVKGEQLVGRSGYQSRAASNKESARPLLCVIAAREQLDLVWLRLAMDTGDDEAVGRLLGYPSCCTRKFCSYWRAGVFDPTWQLACNSESVEVASIELEAGFHPFSNTVLRWLGLRSCFHLPCSFDCQETIDTSKAILSVAESAGFAKEWKWLASALNWRFEWTSLRGIGEVVTPVCRFAFSSDVCLTKRSIKYSSGDVPECSPPGSRFPFKPKSEHGVPLRHALQDPGLSQFSLNGFSTLPSMRLNHNQMLRELVSLLGAHNWIHVVDLGCGNGELLMRIKQRAPRWKITGVEGNVEVLKLTRKNAVDGCFSVVEGDIFHQVDAWTSDHPHAALIAVERLEEIDDSTLHGFVQLVGDRKIAVILYSYDISRGPVRSRLSTLGLKASEASSRLSILHTSRVQTN